MACDCCEGLANGIVVCLDGAVTTLVPPSSGGPWRLVYVPGVGYDWENVAEEGPGSGRKGFPVVPPPRPLGPQA